MAWESRIAGDSTDLRLIQAPLFLCFRSEAWAKYLDGAIDSYTSDPLTLDVLAVLIRHLDAKVILEVGTYRGWGAFTMAEALKASESSGHIWTCDPVDYEIQEVLDDMDLASYVTYHHGILETLLPDVPGEIDLCYLDASDAQEENLRLRHLAMVLPRMRKGGLIVMDDVEKGWSGAAVVRQFAGLVLPGPRGLAVLQVR